MSPTAVCPWCGRLTAPAVEHDPVALQPAEEGYHNLDLDGIAVCPACGEVYGVRALVSLDGEVQEILEVRSPTERELEAKAEEAERRRQAGRRFSRNSVTCPHCGAPGRAEILDAMISLPPTGGDYEWVETDGRAVCPECGEAWEVWVRIDLEDGSTVILDFQPPE